MTEVVLHKTWEEEPFVYGGVQLVELEIDDEGKLWLDRNGRYTYADARKVYEALKEYYSE